MQVPEKLLSILLEPELGVQKLSVSLSQVSSHYTFTGCLTADTTHYYCQ